MAPMKVILLGLAIAASADAASAQAATRPADLLARAVLADQPRDDTRPGLDLARPQASRYASALPAGIARTSIDHRFEDDGAVGSAGYLCGLQPGEKMYGAAGASGYDPMGKFLGAKLTFAFR